ncbi:HAMP domain-containing protein [Cohnella sp. CFH 77786]|nr:HAMP domain-containing protein [Cohnella sp. CFH 77786]
MIWAFVGGNLAGLAASFAVPLEYKRIPLQIAAPLSVLVYVTAFLLAFYFLTRRFVRDLRKLGEGLAVIANGNLHYRVDSARQDELGKVAENVNGMAAKLQRLIEKEREIEKSKMELITGVSHDLRTPLTSLIGYLDLLKERDYRDDSEYDRFVGNAWNKASQLKKLIDDLFEYTRLTTQEDSLRLQTVDFRELIHQIRVEYEPIAEENGIRLEASVEAQPLFVSMDPAKIRRAVDNLLANALKFSVKPGTVRMRLAADRGRARITVENEGRPITKEQESKLFERFYKADDARTSSVFPSGSGLGLSIARSIVELHGGAIRFTHESGRYVFGFELPAEEAGS